MRRAPVTSPWLARALWATVVLGILLRLRQFLFERPLWIDEAMLANNVLARPFRGLLLPLHSDQTAPVPFLWLVKLVSLIAGASEPTLRAVPFIGGMLLLLVAVSLAKRLHETALLSAEGSVVLVLLFALSPMLLRYGNELKPYGVDALWTTLCMVLTVRLMLPLHRHDAGDGVPRNRADWLALLVVGTIISVSMSPAPFVLASVGAALVCTPSIRRHRGALTWLAASSACWGLCFVVAYVLVYRATGHSDYMQRYWVPQFLSPALPDFTGKVARAVPDLLRSWFLADGGAWRDRASLLLLVPIGAGAATLFRRHRGVLVLSLMPLLLAYVASAFRQYPVSPRLMLFCIPGIIVLLVVGLETMAKGIAVSRRRTTLIVAAAMLLFLPGRDAWLQLRTPREIEASRTPIRQFLAGHEPGANVYVLARAVPAWLFYTTDWSAPDLARVERLSAITSSGGVAFRHASSRGAPVREEGDTLAFSYRDWRELIGVSSGTGPDLAGINALAPDPEWADNEARRLAQSAHPDVWAVFSSTAPDWPALIDRALIRRGATRVLLEGHPQAALGRYRLPSRQAGN